MNNNWQTKTLQSLGTFHKGTGIPRDSSYSGKLPAVRYGELYTNYDTFISEKTRSRISEDVAKDALKLEYGDILLAGSGETPEDIGKSAVFLLNEGYAGGDIIVFRPDKTKVNPKFLALYFETEPWKKQRRRVAQGQSIVHIHTTDLKKMIVELPDLETQQKIVQILDTWNNAIDVIKTRLIQEDNLMKYLYAALLSGYKTTGKSNEYVDVELSKVANIERGKTLTAKEIIPGDIPVIAGGIDSPYNHNQYTHENVITVSASGANAGYVDYRHGKIWASDCNVIYGKEGISDTMYIFSWLVLLQKLIYQLQTGGAQPHVHAKDLAKLKISLPPLEIQQGIVMRLSTQAAKISRLEEYRDNLQNQYKYLLNHLISGDFDLTNIKLEKGKE